MPREKISVLRAKAKFFGSELVEHHEFERSYWFVNKIGMWFCTERGALNAAIKHEKEKPTND